MIELHIDTFLPTWIYFQTGTIYHFIEALATMQIGCLDNGDHLRIFQMGLTRATKWLWVKTFKSKMSHNCVKLALTQEHMRLQFLFFFCNFGKDSRNSLCYRKLSLEFGKLLASITDRANKMRGKVNLLLYNPKFGGLKEQNTIYSCSVIGWRWLSSKQIAREDFGFRHGSFQSSQSRIQHSRFRTMAFSKRLDPKISRTPWTRIFVKANCEPWDDLITRIKILYSFCFQLQRCSELEIPFLGLKSHFWDQGHFHGHYLKLIRHKPFLVKMSVTVMTHICNVFKYASFLP